MEGEFSQYTFYKAIELTIWNATSVCLRKWRQFLQDIVRTRIQKHTPDFRKTTAWDENGIDRYSWARNDWTLPEPGMKIILSCFDRTDTFKNWHLAEKFQRRKETKLSFYLSAILTASDPCIFTGKSLTGRDPRYLKRKIIYRYSSETTNMLLQ
jgi:hypothetical protein